MRSLFMLLSSLSLLAGTVSGQAAPNMPRAAAASASLNAPRVYSEGSMTRVVYDLPAGSSYTLTPSFGGLRVDFRNLRATPSVSARLGTSVGEYRVMPMGNGAALSLTTPFPLGLKDGWRATEATIASGSHVLILEIGPSITGGQVTGGQMRAAPLARTAPRSTPNMGGGTGYPAVYNSGANPAGYTTPMVSPALVASAGTRSAALLGAAPLAPALPIPPVRPDAPVSPDQLAPGDTVAPLRGDSLPAPAAALPGAEDGDPNVLVGRALGNPIPGQMLSLPRIGKNPGVTRVVLDLPPGATFRVIPGTQGLNIELTGVATAQQAQDGVSPELRGWRYQATGNSLRVSLTTAAPVTAHTGWRSVFLPPVAGSSYSRLAIDLSPAFANNTPLRPADKVLAAVPPIRSSALAFSGAGLVAQPTVVIDPGHGGIDPGAIGAVVEKEVNLDIALRVRRYLQAAGVNVIMSRDRDTQLNLDKATDLNQRAALGYHGAQFFLSIHANSMPASNILQGYGIETWWNPNNPASASFASTIQSNVIATTGAFSQGLKTGRSLAVLRGSRVPAALIEVGFVGHPVDGTNLKDDNYRERVALGIARGIREALVSGLGMSASK